MKTSGVPWAPAILIEQALLGVERVLCAMDYPYQFQIEEVTMSDDFRTALRAGVRRISSVRRRKPDREPDGQIPGTLVRAVGDGTFRGRKSYDIGLAECLTPEYMHGRTLDPALPVDIDRIAADRSMLKRHRQR